MSKGSHDLLFKKLKAMREPTKKQKRRTGAESRSAITTPQHSSGGRLQRRHSSFHADQWKRSVSAMSSDRPPDPGDHCHECLLLLLLHLLLRRCSPASIQIQIDTGWFAAQGDIQWLIHTHTAAAGRTPDRSLGHSPVDRPILGYHRVCCQCWHILLHTLRIEAKKMLLAALGCCPIRIVIFPAIFPPLIPWPKHTKNTCSAKLTVLSAKSTKANAISTASVSPTKSCLGVNVCEGRVAVIVAAIRFAHEHKRDICVNPLVIMR